jgi:NitT/TauT family transport system permease protein
MMRVRQIAGVLWLPLLLMVLWEGLVSVGVLSPLFFPPPSVLAGTVSDMLADGDLVRHLRATLGRTLRGFLIGTLSGLAVGLLMGSIAFVRRALDPLISAVWASPKLSLLPMLMIIFGVDDAPRIMLIALGCFIVVSLYVLDSVLNVDVAYVELATNYGATRLGVLRWVYLPAVLPAAFTATRLALGRALTLTVSVELVSSPEGLGNMIFLAWQGFTTDRLYIGIALAAGMGLLFHTSLRLLESRLITWRTGAAR